MIVCGAIIKSGGVTQRLPGIDIDAMLDVIGNFLKINSGMDYILIGVDGKSYKVEVEEVE